MILQWVDWLVLFIAAIGMLYALCDAVLNMWEHGFSNRMLRSMIFSTLFALAIALYWKFLAG